MSVNVDLFEGIKECTAEEQSLFAALLEHGHLGRIIGPILIKMVSPFLKRLNLSFSEVTFEEIIQISKQEYLKLSVDDRIKAIIEMITKRLRCTRETDPRVISLLVMQFVARNYGIDEMALPKDMAYRIMMAFFDKMEKAYKKAWENANDAQRREMDEKIEERINQMSDSERRAIQSALNLDNLSAATIRNVIINTSPTVLLSSVVSVAGFSAYMALSIMVHAIFTTVLGITLPFGIYMGLSTALSTLSGPLAPVLIGGGALIAWIKSGKELNRNLIEMVMGMGLARSFLRGDFKPIEDRYLSYYAESDKLAFIEESESLENMRRAIATTEKDIRRQESEINKTKSLISDLKERQNHSVALIENYKGDIATAAKLIEASKHENLIKQSEDIEDLKRQLEQAKSDSETALRLAEEEERKRIKSENQIMDSEEKIIKLDEDKQKLQKELQRYQYNEKGFIKKREAEMRFRYEAIYTNISISKKAYNWLASQTDLGIVVAAEKAFYEYNNGNFILHERGKIAGSSYYHNSFGPKDAYRVYYRKSNGKVCIADIGH